MIFRRRSKYKLPKFPDTVEGNFLKFCEDLPVEAVAEIREELNLAVAEILNEARDNKLIDASLVRKLHKAALGLLERYESYDKEGREIAIGAIRYFVVADDSLPDSGFSSGFYDDAQVMNHVLEQLGEDDLIIDL